VTVREAKAHFSEMVRAAAAGTEIIVTSHGEPRVRLVPVQPQGRPFKVNRRLLAVPPVRPVTRPAEELIREDRDARD